MPTIYVVVDESGCELGRHETRPGSGLVLEVKGPREALRAWSGLAIERKPRRPPAHPDYRPRGPLEVARRLLAWARVRQSALRKSGRLTSTRLYVSVDQLQRDARDLEIDLGEWAEFGWLDAPMLLPGGVNASAIRLDHPELAPLWFHEVSR